MDEKRAPGSAASQEDRDLTEEGLRRRKALSKIGLAAIGMGAVLIGGSTLWELAGKSAHSPSTNESSRTTTNFSQMATQSTTYPSGSTITIKVAYFGMPSQITGTKQEYITFKSPVYLGSVISEVTQRHTALIPMIGAMQILVDGNPVEPNQELSDRDELDFIPIQAGG